MKQIEKNLKVWNTATGQAAPTKADLMHMRSLDLEPKQIGANRWETVSTSRRGVVYQQEVFFAGYSDAGVLGFELNIVCGCPASGVCKHVLKLHRVYDANLQYVFDLFNLPQEARFSELYEKAAETYARMETNRFQQAA